MALFGGFIDYLNYINLGRWSQRRGHDLGGSETRIQQRQGRQNATERLKTKARGIVGADPSISTGISYALIDKTAADKIPLAMVGYGRTDATDGSVFPRLPLVTTTRCRPRPSSDT